MTFGDTPPLEEVTDKMGALNVSSPPSFFSEENVTRIRNALGLNEENAQEKIEKINQIMKDPNAQQHMQTVAAMVQAPEM